MAADDGKQHDQTGAAKWYELFSRGARDWLRHDEKVREAVRANLPEIIAGGDLINEGARTVRALSLMTSPPAMISGRLARTASRTFSSWRSQSRAPRENSSYHFAALSGDCPP